MPAKFSLLKLILRVVSVILLIVVIRILVFIYPMLPPFYYADYNAVRDQLAKIPDTQIVDTWLHEDLTLEDFGFTLQKASCPPITLNFYQVHGSRWRANFQSIDGVILVNSGRTSIAPYTRMRLDRAELAAANLPVHTIADVFTQLEPLLQHLNEQPTEIADGIQGADAEYAYLSYDGGLCTATEASGS